MRNKEIEPKYSLYHNKEGDECDSYLFLRLEIPGNIDRIIERKTNPKTEKYRGIIIKALKKRGEFDVPKTENVKEITDNRKYDKFVYFIKSNLIINKTYQIENTGIYVISIIKIKKKILTENKIGII